MNATQVGRDRFVLRLITPPQLGRNPKLRPEARSRNYSGALDAKEEHAVTIDNVLSLARLPANASSGRVWEFPAKPTRLDCTFQEQR